MKHTLILFFVLLITLTSSTVYAQTPFRDTAGLTKNGIEWCEENYQLYKIMENDFFEHHQHSIESRLCGNLYNDELWMYNGQDRYQKLIEQSRIYYALEIEESINEAKEGKIDTKPVIIQEPTQEIEQQQKEIEEAELAEIQPKEIKTDDSIEQIQSKESKGGGCLIATAAYGTELAPQVQFLREIRDNTVMSTASGASFMTGFNQIYYSFSPTIADWQRENPMFQEAVRAFITPMISTLSIMTLAEDGSEVEVLGLGISVIALNLAMYIAAPALIGFKVHKSLKSFKE
ncbi:CFI-box-CTERM domain-containing protein [Nitrosopumilus sp. S6]